MSKYGVFSGPHFPVFGLNTGKYRPEKTLYLDTFHAVIVIQDVKLYIKDAERQLNNTESYRPLANGR